MKTQINYLIPLLLIFFISNIYSQTERFDKLLENRINKPINNKHNVVTDDFLNNEKSANRIVRTMQKQVYDSLSVIDSAISIREDGSKTKSTFSYDSNGNMTLDLREDWDGNQWVNRWRKTFSYDSNGNMTLDLGEDWDGSQWVNRWRNTNTYDSNGNKKSALYEDWDGSQWIGYSRFISTYDSNGNMTLQLDEEWDGSQWMGYQLETYAYDSNGNHASTLFEHRNGSQWENFYRHIFTYNSIRNVTSFLGEEWDGGQWVNDWRNTNTYDSNGNMTLQLDEYWNDSQWVNLHRLTYTHDSNGKWTRFLSEALENANWVLRNYGGFGGIDYTDSYGNLYNFWSCAKIEMYYKTITDINKGSITITNFSLSQNYPNPFNPTTKISYSIPSRSYVTLKVFDVLGRAVATLVDKEQSSGNYEIDFGATNLTSGIYFYRIQAGDFLETKKMILMK